MKGYNLKKAKEFNHPTPNKNTYGPTIFVQPQYGKNIQYAYVDESAKLTDKEIKKVQKIAGSFLYSGRAIDSTIMHVLNEINIESTKATEKQEKQ